MESPFPALFIKSFLFINHVAYPYPACRFSVQIHSFFSESAVRLLSGICIEYIFIWMYSFLNISKSECTDLNIFLFLYNPYYSAAVSWPPLNLFSLSKIFWNRLSSDPFQPSSWHWTIEIHPAKQSLMISAFDFLSELYELYSNNSFQSHRMWIWFCSYRMLSLFRRYDFSMSLYSSPVKYLSAKILCESGLFP